MAATFNRQIEAGATRDEIAGALGVAVAQCRRGPRLLRTRHDAVSEHGAS
jgi:hypothetical protein